MVDRAQLLKGLLEGCILKIIEEGETYGYEINNELKKSGFIDINEGSVYSVLMRLEKKGYVDSMMKKSSQGPRRKYYKIVPSGEKYLESFKQLWYEVSGAVNGIIERGDEV